MLAEVKPYASARQLYQSPGMEVHFIHVEQDSSHEVGEVAFASDVFPAEDLPGSTGDSRAGPSPARGCCRGAPAPSAVHGPGVPALQRSQLRSTGFAHTSRYSDFLGFGILLVAHLIWVESGQNLSYIRTSTKSRTKNHNSGNPISEGGKMLPQESLFYSIDIVCSAEGEPSNIFWGCGSIGSMFYLKL